MDREACVVELGIQEAQVESDVVTDQDPVRKYRADVADDLGKCGRIPHLSGGYPMDVRRPNIAAGVHESRPFPFRTQVRVERNQPDLDDAIVSPRKKTRCLQVQYGKAGKRSSWHLVPLVGGSAERQLLGLAELVRGQIPRAMERRQPFQVGDQGAAGRGRAFGGSRRRLRSLRSLVEG